MLEVDPAGLHVNTAERSRRWRYSQAVRECLELYVLSRVLRAAGRSACYHI